MYQSMVGMTDPLCNEGTNLKIFLIAGIILKCKWDYSTPTCVLCLFSFSCVPISMKLFPSVYACLSSHPSSCPSVCPCIWPSARLSLHFFYIAHFDHLILTLDLKGVRLVGLITFQVDAVGLPVSSWVRRTETVRAAFELADRPVLGEDRKVLGSIGIIVSHFYSWLGLPMERGR